MQWRQQVLLVQVFQDAGRAGCQVAVQQNGARVEILDAEAALAAHHGLQQQQFAVGQLDLLCALDRRVDGADLHVQARHPEDARQLREVTVIRRRLELVVRDDQQVARFGADLLDGRLRRLHGQRQHGLGQVVPAAREEVGVHWRQLEASIAHVHRGVEGRRVLHPFEAEPALDGRRAFEHALLQFIEGAGQGGDEVGDHSSDLVGLVLGGGES